MTLINRSLTRRNALALAALSISMTPNIGCTGDKNDATPSNNPAIKNEHETERGDAMRIYYVEIVTKDVEAICSLYSTVHGTEFGDADRSLGGARTIRLAGGELLGVRAPLHEGEKPVVGPYIRVEDIESAVALAQRNGAVVIVAPMSIPGRGTCAIVDQGGNEIGFWQV